MYFPKQCNVPKRKKVRRCFTFLGGITEKQGGESVFNASHRLVASRAVNFRSCNGELSDGAGLTAYTQIVLPDAERAKAVYRCNRTLYVLSVTGKLYCQNDTGAFELFHPEPVLYCGRPVLYESGQGVPLILFPTNHGLIIHGDEGNVAGNSVWYRDVCIYGERLFGVTANDPARIEFSAILQPNDFTQKVNRGGYVRLPSDAGEVLRLFSIRNALYAVRKNGVTRIEGKGETLGFTAETKHLANGAVYGKSAAVAGENIVYMATDGFYLFNGTSAKRVFTHVRNLPEYEGGEGVYADGKYYVLLAGGDIFCGDLSTDEGYVITADADGISRIVTEEGEKLAVLRNNVVLCFLSYACDMGVPMEKEWVSEAVDTGGDGERKILRKLCILARGQMRLWVRSEYGMRWYELNSRGELSVFHPNLPGSLFTIGIRSSAPGCAVSRIYTETETGV